MACATGRRADMVAFALFLFSLKTINEVVAGMAMGSSCLL
jgi:hypothetical protein